MSTSNERGWLSEKRLWFFWNFLNFLEDPRHPTVGPHLRLLGFTGQWHPKLDSTLARFKLTTFFVIIFCFCSQYFKFFVSADISSFLLILQYAPFHMGVVKTCYFQKDYNTWKKLIDYVSSTERKQLSQRDDDVIDAMNNYIRRSRRFTYFFWTLAIFTNVSIFSVPYQKNRMLENGTDIYIKLFDIVTPFDQETPPGYYVSMAIQTVMGNIMSAYIVGWDTIVVSMMIFFAGQLKISRIYCTKVIMSNIAEQCHGNIVNCHNFHIRLIDHQKLFNKLISSVMGVYLLVVSVNLGVCIIQIAALKNDFAALVASVFYVAACLIQLLFFYWYGNQVTEESVLLNYGVFECDFVKMDAKILKELNLLQLSTSKRIIFKAGPFSEISISTFVAILRSSYSFYTLLNKTK